MNLDSVFQPAVEIHYVEHDPEVLVQTFSIDGRVHTHPPRKLKHENLPTLLFQLADRGYQIIPNPVKFGVRVVRAFSPAFMEHARQAAAREAQP